MLLDLNLSVNEIGNEGVIAIANSLREDDMEHGHCYLKRLSLEWSQITDEGASHLAKCLEKNSKLTYLNIAHNKIGSQGAVQLANTFKINFTLKEVFFHDNNMDDEGAKAFSLALEQKNCHIETFTWDKNTLLTSKGEFKLSHVFQYRESLKTWLSDLEDNLRQDQCPSVNWWSLPNNVRATITDLEVSFLVHTLGKYNPERLQSIWLAGQHISDESIVQLCRIYLAENPSLQRFYLKNVNLESAGINAISQALCTNSNLRVLSISNCGLTALAGAGVLAIALKHNSTIQRINLQGNDIGDEGFRMLWDAIRRPHPSIISLNVSNNQLTDASVSSMYSTEDLQELYLNGNQITDKGALDLAKAIMDRTMLKILSIGNNTLMTHRGKTTLRLFAPNRFSA
jgi:Ran GTPase-activating protein (RanGAP) involved in mRNA processing and transport